MTRSPERWFRTPQHRTWALPAPAPTTLLLCFFCSIKCPLTISQAMVGRESEHRAESFARGERTLRSAGFRFAAGPSAEGSWAARRRGLRALGIAAFPAAGFLFPLRSLFPRPGALSL